MKKNMKNNYYFKKKWLTRQQGWGLGYMGIGDWGLGHCVHSCKFIAYHGDSKSIIPRCLASISFGSHSQH